MLSFAFIAPVVINVLHRGPKPSIMTSAALVLVGNWVRFAGSHKVDPEGGNFGVVMFGQILTGLAQPFALAAPTRYSDMWFTVKGRVAATAVTSLANPLGAAIGQLVVPELVAEGKSEQVSRMVLYVAIIVGTSPPLPPFSLALLAYGARSVKKEEEKKLMGFSPPSRASPPSLSPPHRQPPWRLTANAPGLPSSPPSAPFFAPQSSGCSSSPSGPM